MQKQALHLVIEHLSDTFHFDKNETKKLLKLLRRTLAEAIPNLLSADPGRIYRQAHKLHSELHSCGYEQLSEMAEAIELRAKSGSVSQPQIDEFLAQAADFATAIDLWLVANG